MKREFKCYCVDVSGDGSEFELVFEMNGKVVDKEVYYCMDDVLSSAYDMYRRNCEKYSFDSRFDKLVINISYRF